MNKEEVRNKILSWRNELDLDSCNKKSQKALLNLIQLPSFNEAKNILFYYSVKKEVHTHEIIQKLIKEKNIFLPVITKPDHFEYSKIDSLKSLSKGPEGIPEPIYKASDQKINLDLIIIPGVAFSKKGVRVGMGKGYYDRFLNNKKHLKKIALAFEEQVLDSVPKDPYDVDVDIIVTDQNIYRCCPGL